MNSYERLLTLSIQDVFDAIREKRIFTFGGLPCHTDSVRLKTYFVHGIQCAWEGCKCKGVFFGVERQITRTGKIHQKGYHLNFYGFNEQGHEVMMTSDHRVPKSRGGDKYNIANRQPMCKYHNERKGNSLIYT